MAASFAARLAFRDWRSGELTLLLCAILVAVASVTAIGLFVDRLQRALIEQSATFLAADRVLSGSTAAPDALRLRASELGLQQAETISFATVLYAGDERNKLASVKAVSAQYPLRGKLIVSAEPFGIAAPTDELPQPGEAWLDSRLFPALDIALGDQVDIGLASLRVTRVLTREPDRGSGFTDLAPRVLMRIEDVEATEMVQPGSRVRFRYLLRGDDADLASAYAALDANTQKRFRWLGARDSSQAIGSALDRAESFLLLGGLLAVLLAGGSHCVGSPSICSASFRSCRCLKNARCDPEYGAEQFFGNSVVSWFNGCPSRVGDGFCLAKRCVVVAQRVHT